MERDRKAGAAREWTITGEIPQEVIDAAQKAMVFDGKRLTCAKCGWSRKATIASAMVWQISHECKGDTEC